MPRQTKPKNVTQTAQERQRMEHLAAVLGVSHSRAVAIAIAHALDSLEAGQAITVSNGAGSVTYQPRAGVGD